MPVHSIKILMLMQGKNLKKGKNWLILLRILPNNSTSCLMATPKLCLRAVATYSLKHLSIQRAA